MRYPPLRYYLEKMLRDMGGVSRTEPLRLVFPESRSVFEARESEPEMCHQTFEHNYFRGCCQGEGF